MNQMGDPFEDAAQSSQVVNAPESTACKRDVPLLVPVKHLLWGFRWPWVWWKLKTAPQIVSSVISQSLAEFSPLSISHACKPVSYLHYIQRCSVLCLGRPWYGIAQLTRPKRHMFQNAKPAGIASPTSCNEGSCRTCDSVHNLLYRHYNVHSSMGGTKDGHNNISSYGFVALYHTVGKKWIKIKI